MDPFQPIQIVYPTSSPCLSLSLSLSLLSNPNPSSIFSSTSAQSHAPTSPVHATSMADDSDAKHTSFLHGDLDLFIIQARSLPNLDALSSRLHTLCSPCHSTVPKSVDSAESSASDGGGGKLHHHRNIITSDPYVTVVVPQVTLARTRVIKNAADPHWNQRFHIPIAHPFIDLEFHVKDNDFFGAQSIGIAKISADDLRSGKLISGWFPLVSPKGKPPKADTAIQLEIKFTPCEKNQAYRHGIAGDPNHNGVRDAYFPLRKGNHVTLYQDAHVAHDSNNLHHHHHHEIELDDNKVFKADGYWDNVCYAMAEAHHMIYVVGWSLYDKVKLIREPTRPLPRSGDLTVGELLKYKSREGVRVLLLIWDDRTSQDKFGIKTKGVMNTHDEDTRKFFKDSSVICMLAPRYASSKLSIFKQQLVGTIFSHHQKFILVDTQASGNDRKITAFVGGMDLCFGRYDTPEHRLFRDLDTVFKDDFYNRTYPAESGIKAPRQPWHDLHCRIDGPAAYDVLINFEQRWRKAQMWKDHGQILKMKKKSRLQDDALLEIGRISWILSPPLSVLNDGTTVIPRDDPTVHVSTESDHENWHVQIFRSIDSSSVNGFPNTSNDSEAQNLFVSKSMVVDKSIQNAYIQAIRSANHFIYIENQYFLGSSYAWPSYKKAGVDHLIPVELALKVASKIRANERFAVYIVIPMYPEGDPKSGVMQEILYWQSQTMQMMYSIVAQELKSMQLEDCHPQDYLNFYCLGNREENSVKASSSNGDKVSDSQKYQRFMIYVHAKAMIVDDEYVIVGSANVNQRSMAGSKDSELAMGAYQPHHTWSSKNKHPRGQVYGYRMSLWREHIGLQDDLFLAPESLNCVKKVNSIAQENWKKYTSPDFERLQGHLLRYPLQVTADGTVEPLPGQENLPDVGGTVIGAHSAVLPDLITT